ncbi:tyrosyl-tRNA synthetase, putative [Eimeria necatrix]|uniref:tyrosine--tRNA ligase n=1 Tax=Eimeria necatrix TaxID=51315 RepID=U6MPX4_9EIME|nr:tyrosyl-tRNA synthetase, putative [Eimeria necatrix]CDJ63720.1 tyrosyl-tRNA synthetase, putative [Eimeria necatrix]
MLAEWRASGVCTLQRRQQRFRRSPPLWAFRSVFFRNSFSTSFPIHFNFHFGPFEASKVPFSRQIAAANSPQGPPPPKFQKAKMASPFTGGLAFWDSHIQQNEDSDGSSTAGAAAAAAGAAAAAAGAAAAAAAATATGAAANGILASLPKPRPSSLSLEERFQLCLKVAEECVQPEIRKVGEYFVEVWKSAGMEMENVHFLWASEVIGKDPEAYWTLVMNIAKANSISRIKRCSQIMGRTEGDDQPAAQILYPCMQCADIFYLNADICQLGMDQRKVNMLAREYCDEVKRKHKPVILSHPMLPGLLEGQEKMSKSNADSAIFMEDSEAEVNRKIKKAFCPPAQVHGNPCVAYVERLVFPDKEFRVERTLENGGDKVFKTAEEFKKSFAAGELHPADLKAALAREINRQLEPVRRHFQTDANAKKLLQEISKFKITR